MKNVVNLQGRSLRPADRSGAAPTNAPSDKFFDVVMTGEIVPGQDPTAVAHRLTKLLRLPLEETRKLVAGRVITLKSNTPAVIALRYMHAINGVGAVARIIPVTAKPKRATDGPATESKGDRQRKTDQAETAAPTDAEELTAPVLRKKLDFRLIPSHIDLAGTLRLLAVGMAVITLPALYLALASGVIAGTFWHITSNFDWVTSGSSPILWIPYLTVALAGLLIGGMLMKPLVAPIAPPASAMPFSPEREPLLYTFVECIAQAVSAPVPEELAYSWQSSLMADANGGILASFRRRVRLVIGLPALGALTMTQLASLMAMELARFSNRPHYRLVYLIDAVHLMLFNSAYENDYWDSVLDKAARNSTGLRALSLVAMQGLVRLSRYPMVGLNALCELISSATLFEFRLNSDRYAAALAGAKETRLALTRIEALNAAQPLVVDEIFHRWQMGERTARIPQVIIEQSHNLPAHALITLRSNAHMRSRGPLGIYPALKRRFNALSVLPQAGLAALDGAATELVAAYDSLCAVATQDYFEAMVVYRESHASRPSLGELNIPRTERHAILLKHYFRGGFHPDRYLVPERRDKLSLGSLTGVTKELQQLVARIESRMEDYARDLARYDALRGGTPRDRTVFSAASANGVFRTSPTPRAINVYHAHTGRISEERLEQQLWQFESLVERRMGIALAVALRNADATTVLRIETLIETQKVLARAKPMMDSLLHLANVIRHGLHPAPGKQAMNANALRRQLTRCRDAYIALLAFLCQGRYPFQGGADPDYIANYFQHRAGHPDAMLASPEQCVSNAHAVLENTRALHRMVMAELAEHAARGEKELGQRPSSRNNFPPNIDPQLVGVF